MYEQIAKDLAESLHLKYPMIAVAFSDNGPSAPMYSGNAPAGCAFWQEAFKGPIKTTAKDHVSCSIGIYTHNLTEPPAGYEQQLEAVLHVLREMQYVREEDL